MKKISIVLFLLSSLFSEAQYHDVTVSTLSVVLDRYTITYEYIFLDDKSVGLQIGMGANNDFYFDNFSATPFCRYYFGDDANLLFTEAFVKISNYDVTNLDFPEDNFKGIGIAPGVGAGWKVVYKPFIIGVNLGLGYNFTEYWQDKIAKRGALFVGWRF